MKTPQLHLYLFLFLSSFLAFIAASSPPFPLPPVIGDDGKELKLGKPYYLFSTIFPRRDGLCLVNNVNCPEDIIQCPTFYDRFNFMPVTFSSVNRTEDTVVRENTRYRVEVTVPGIFACVPGKFWYIKDVGNPSQQFVAIGPNTVAIEFIIQRDTQGYRFIYCVVLPIPPIPICYGIGFAEQNGFKRLGFGEGVRPVQFYFANNVSSISATSFHKLPLF